MLDSGRNIFNDSKKIVQISSFNDFCEVLSISSRLLYYLLNKKNKCYSKIEIPKKDGTHRVLHVPSFSMKVVQKWILHNILEKVEVSNQSMAFTRHRGIRKNAEFHKENVFLLKMDIKNFFGNITYRKVFDLFLGLGYSSSASGILTSICTYKFALPQGAVTSPYIANLVCSSMDTKIENYCNLRDISYTRYADDLCFSTNDKALLLELKKVVKDIVYEEGFRIHTKKTKLLSNYMKKTITGITINDGLIKVNKEFKKCLRSQIFNSIKSCDYRDKNQIVGKIAYINSIEDGFRDMIVRNYISRIIMRSFFTENIDIVNAFNKNKFYDDLPDMLFKESLFDNIPTISYIKG